MVVRSRGGGGRFSAIQLAASEMRIGRSFVWSIPDHPGRLSQAEQAGVAHLAGRSPRSSFELAKSMRQGRSLALEWSARGTLRRGAPIRGILEAGSENHLHRFEAWKSRPASRPCRRVIAVRSNPAVTRRSAVENVYADLSFTCRRRFFRLARPASSMWWAPRSTPTPTGP